MSKNEGQTPAGEPLDEIDVERVIADEDAVPSDAFVQGLAAAEPAVPAPMDAPTTEDLEGQLENNTPGPEGQMRHAEDAVTEVLDDERDVVEGDLSGEAGDELEWRMDAQQEQDETLGGGAATPRAESRDAAMALIRPDDPVRVLMSMPVACIEPDVSLADLADRLAAECVGALAVMSGDHLDGVVSERDIVRALAAGGDPTKVWVADVMADEPVYVDVDDPILSVAERMLDEGVRHMPVVSDGRVLGVVSVRDALRVLADAWRRSPEGETRQRRDE